MIVGVAHVALLVREYEEAKKFYCGKLGFKVVEDTQLPYKRWVRIQAPGKQGSEILLSRAADEKQAFSIGNQAGGRVFGPAGGPVPPVYPRRPSGARCCHSICHAIRPPSNWYNFVIPVRQPITLAR